MNASKPNFDYSTPFDIMVGRWTGHAIMYDAHGEYLYTGPSLVSIYWTKRGKVLHYHQEDLGELDKVLQHPYENSLKDIVTRDFNLVITGKSCKSEKIYPSVTGVESCPGTYLFDLSLEGGHYYNNQYFQNPNERHIIGPFIPDGGTGIGAVVSQTFTRISYDVPDQYRIDATEPLELKKEKREQSHESETA